MTAIRRRTRAPKPAAALGKPVAGPYQTGTRTGMQKLKHRWTADCVVGGFRYATGSR